MSLIHEEVLEWINAYRPLSKKSYDDGNELVIHLKGAASLAMFVYRGKGRHRGKKIKLGRYPEMSLADARALRDHIQRELNSGVTPARFALSTYNKGPDVRTVNDAFSAQYEDRLLPYIKSHERLQRIFTRLIKPVLGDMMLEEVTVRHVEQLLKTIPSEANRGAVLSRIRSLFQYAHDLNYVSKNRFGGLRRSFYGISHHRSDKTLAPHDIPRFFQLCELHQISRVDVLAMALYLTLAVRKCELLQAVWREFNLDAGVWDLPRHRAKEKHSIAIPLPDEAVSWLQELRSYHPNSDYVFPARKKSRAPTLNESTLNKVMHPVFKEMNINLHGQRHAAYTLLQMEGVPEDVREVCLNHRTKATYGHSRFFKERKWAHQKLARLIAPHVPASPFA